MREPINGTHYTAIDPPPYEGIKDFGTSRTRQSEAKAADINTIMKKYIVTSVLPQNKREGLFTDVSEMPDYRTSLDLIRKADEMFMDLPADVRVKFNNDAAVFLDWTSDPNNRDDMIEMGLLPKAEQVGSGGSGTPDVPVLVNPPAAVEPIVSETATAADPGGVS